MKRQHGIGTVTMARKASQAGKALRLPLLLAGVFVAVGLTPNSQCFSNILELDDAGYIIIDETMATSSPGIFAAGDIRRNSARQITAAVGDGATAAVSSVKYLQELR